MVSDTTDNEAPSEKETPPELERVEFIGTKTPVEGCDLLPYVVVRTPLGEIKSAEALESRTKGALSVQYRWNRLTAKYSCALPNCFVAATVQFVPLIKIAAERKMSDEQRDAVVRESFFCSNECMVTAWPRLRTLQSNYSNNLPYLPNALPTDGDGERDRMRRHFAKAKDERISNDPLENPEQMKEIGWIRNFAPTVDDIGHRLKLVCRAMQRKSTGEVSVGSPLSVLSDPVKALPSPPPIRRLMSLATNELYFPKNRRPDSLRVLSYNTLAEIYGTKASFPSCPEWALAWTYRRRNLVREIANYDADIICLQEVQQDHYEDHFSLWFGRQGYEGIYIAKTREAMGRKGKIDGCATLFRKDKFILRERQSVEFNAIAHGRTEDTQVLTRCLKGNVGLITILDCVDGSGPLVIANTHAYWDPECWDVKLFQIDAFLQEVEGVVNRLGGNVPLILCGDFNSTPDSNVYDLLSTGAASVNMEELEPAQYGLLATSTLHHSMNLRSSYSLTGSEPRFTNYTHQFAGTLDYQFFTPDYMIATAIMEMPDENSLISNNEIVLPNTQWSSDHIALMTEYQLLKT